MVSALILEVVLMDMHMPGWDGAETTKWILIAHPHYCDRTVYSNRAARSRIDAECRHRGMLAEGNHREGILFDHSNGCYTGEPVLSPRSSCLLLRILRP